MGKSEAHVLIELFFKKNECRHTVLKLTSDLGLICFCVFLILGNSQVHLSYENVLIKRSAVGELRGPTEQETVNIDKKTELNKTKDEPTSTLQW